MSALPPPLQKVDAPWFHELTARLAARQEQIRRRDAKGKRYGELLAALPAAFPSRLKLDAARVLIGEAEDLTVTETAGLRRILQELRPWRKGPFRLFGIDIDSEWDSSLKWERLADAIAPLGGRRILDVGSSCGYYLLRMAVDQPQLALGLEPYLTYYFQYRLLQRFARQPQVATLPLRFEELPEMPGYFDTLFCMGVLYHCRSPLDTLLRLRDYLRPGGELVLETLVLDGEGERALFPSRRYAKMKNIYFIPTLDCLCAWLERAGFAELRCLDVTRTTAREQRRTPWVGTESLEDFLDPVDPDRTVEGYPAPVRAVLLARRP